MQICYEPPVRTATGPFGYSVQSNLDSLFFDFDRRVFRRYLDIAPKARSEPLVCRDGRWVGDFNHMDDDGVYSVCVRDASDSYRVVSKHTRVCGNFQRLTLPTVDERERERVDHRQSTPSQPTKFQATKKPDGVPEGAELVDGYYVGPVATVNLSTHGKCKAREVLFGAEKGKGIFVAYLTPDDRRAYQPATASLLLASGQAKADAAKKPGAERALALRTSIPSEGLKQVDIDAVDLLVLHRVLYHDDGTPTTTWVSFEQIWGSVWADGYGIYYSKQYVQGHIETSLMRLYHKGRIKVQNGLLYRSDEPRMLVRCRCGQPNYGVPVTHCPNCGKEYTHRMDYRPPNPFRQRPTSSTKASRPVRVEQPVVSSAGGSDTEGALAFCMVMCLLVGVVSLFTMAFGGTSGWIPAISLSLAFVFIVWGSSAAEKKKKAEKAEKAKPLSDHPLYEPLIDANFTCVDVTK
jgi:hypothetical protein